MRLLIVHNSYIHRGGEDVCVQNELNALHQAGLQISVHTVSSTRTRAGVVAALGAPWGLAEEARLENVIQKQRPDILHAHNLFPLLSPRLFRQARALNIKTVLTLHNYRPLCMNGLFMTPEGEVCERCAGGNYSCGVKRACYRSSYIQSAGLAAHLSFAAKRHWYEEVDLFIAPSRFLKEKYVNYGFPAAKIQVQGHFLPQWPETPAPSPTEDVLYLGRLAEEKGLRWLVDSFITSSTKAVLTIAGDGPLRPWIEQIQHPRIRYRGPLHDDAKSNAIRSSRAVVMASRCYENFPMVVPEANSHGVPMLVPRYGAMADCVTSGVNGETYEAGNQGSFWKALEKIDKSFSTSSSRASLKSWAQRHFSMENFLKTRLTLYQNIPHLASTH